MKTPIIRFNFEKKIIDKIIINLINHTEKLYIILLSR